MINPQFDLIAAHMAIVLSLQENMDLLLFLVKLAIAIGAIAIALLLLFWFRLKKIERQIYRRRRQLKSRFTQNITQRIPQQVLSKPQKALGLPQVSAKRPMGSSFATSTKRSPQPSVYLTDADPRLLKRSMKRSSRVRLYWLWAIMASMMGIAIALIQIGNSFISPEYMSIIWLLVGFTLVMSSTFIEIA